MVLKKETFGSINAIFLNILHRLKNTKVKKTADSFAFKFLKFHTSGNTPNFLKSRREYILGVIDNTF